MFLQNATDDSESKAGPFFSGSDIGLEQAGPVLPRQPNAVVDNINDDGVAVALRPHGDVLTMETLNYADEVVDAETLDEAGSADVEVSDRELAVARQLIEMLSGPFDAAGYHDDYRDAVLALIERSAA